MRFVNMCRNMFVVMAIAGCAILVPLNWVNYVDPPSSWVLRLTPGGVWNNAQWGTVVCAWIFNISVIGGLWWNYRKVLHLRREYFESPEYQRSLHARTLMVRCRGWTPACLPTGMLETLTMLCSFMIFPRNWPPTRASPGSST